LIRRRRRRRRKRKRRRRGRRRINETMISFWRFKREGNLQSKKVRNQKKPGKDLGEAP